jgi:hypothetical protein
MFILGPFEWKYKNTAWKSILNQEVLTPKPAGPGEIAKMRRNGIVWHQKDLMRTALG